MVLTKGSRKGYNQPNPKPSIEVVCHGCHCNFMLVWCYIASLVKGTCNMVASPLVVSALPHRLWWCHIIHLLVVPLSCRPFAGIATHLWGSTLASHRCGHNPPCPLVLHIETKDHEKKKKKLKKVPPDEKPYWVLWKHILSKKG